LAAKNAKFTKLQILRILRFFVANIRSGKQGILTQQLPADRQMLDQQ
jgi:hypothetical protein